MTSRGVARLDTCRNSISLDSKPLRSALDDGTTPHDKPEGTTP